MKNLKRTKRLLSLALCLAMVLSLVPVPMFTAQAAAAAETVADPGTADTWESMMGTDSDGNRYAGRVWADKSVYTDGQTARLNSSNNVGSAFTVDLADDEAFQVVFSVLGSSMTTTTSTSTTGPMDVVLVLDTSTSMDDYTDGNVTRLQKVIEAANVLIDDLLTIHNVRIAIVTYNADSETVLPLTACTNGLDLVVTNYLNNGRNGAGVVYAYDNDRRLLGNDSGYTMGTNLQSGIDRGFNILADAQNVEGRIPVAIVLTDGQANRAVRNRFYEIDGLSISSTTDERMYLSTLLNAGYNKTKVEANYGTEQKVYSISVDLDANSEAHALMNPADASHGFNSSNRHSDITTAYRYFTQWSAGQTVNIGNNNNSRWTFDHNYTLPAGKTRQDIAENVYYVSENSYYDVSSAELEDTFGQIYKELSSGAFNPITSSATVDGATGVDNTPLIYVDNIGKHMEVKEIQSVTLFGASYGVTKNANGTYTVATGTGTNPTTNETWNTAEDIKISVTENADGTQKLQVEINQEILPIILEQVTDKTVGNVSTATISELTYSPLRVYYTIGVDSDVLLPNGDIDVSKIQGYTNINNTTGEITFYSNAFGNVNTADTDNNGYVDMGDAHVGFKPSLKNRYYYYQTSQDIFTEVSAKDGSAIQWDAEEFGVRYEKDKYNFTWLTYDKYSNLQDSDRVYTYVSYYHPTPSQTDAATAAEQVTYIIRPEWRYLKESVAFYDHTAETYINYDAANGYVTGEVGYAVPVDKVSQTIAAYKQANPNADIYAMLGVESLRTSRLHNMIAGKEQNLTGTADNRYDPEYTYETAADHHDNDVVIWLGNNGKLTTTVDTGIALTKAVTEAIGNPNDTYALTVTVPSDVTTTPTVKNADGETVASTYQNHVLTVNVKAGETVYISGIPAGKVCTIGEVINGDYHISSKTDTVTVPTLSQVLAGAAQFAPATVTNAPNKYGSVIIGKAVVSTIEAHQNKEFSFTVTLTGSDLVANKDYVATRSDGQTYHLKANTPAQITLKHNQYVTVEGLPGGTVVTSVEADYSGVGFTVNQATQSATVVVDNVQYLNYQNTYAAQSVTNGTTVVVKGSKDLQSNANLTASFNFKLQRYVWADSSYRDITGGTASVNYNNETGDKSFGFDFSGEAYTSAGTYYYRIVEIEDAIYEAAGVVFDPTPAYFSVIVSDDGEGQLYISDVVAGTDAAVAKSGNTWTVTGSFVNTYSVTGAVEVTLNIQKAIKADYGVTIPPAGFSFDLFEADDQWTEGALVKTSSVTGAGGLSDIPLVFDDAVNDIGKHYYVIKEHVPAQKDDRITYSTQKYGVEIEVGHESAQFTVTVTTYDLNGATPVVIQTLNGTGTTGVITASTQPVTFQNVFKPEMVGIRLEGTKTLIGKDSDTGFTFEIDAQHSGGHWEKSTTAHVDGVSQTIDLGDYAYRSPGVYQLKIREKIPADAVNNVKDGITYDDSEYLVTITVTGNDRTGELTLDYTITKDGVPASIDFVNTYEAKPTEYTLSGTKVLEGRAPGNGEFSFELWEGSTKLETVKNKADGSFSFKAISYAEPGTHTYTIKEAPGNSPGVTYAGVNSPVTVVVTVTDENAQLKAQANVANASIQFVNRYVPTAAKVTFTGTKTLEGGTLTDNSFAFHLYETDRTFNIAGRIPKDTEKNVNGAFAFDTVTFDKTGTFFYAVVEDTSAPAADVVYDRTQHNFRVQVSDAGDGQLRAVVTDLNTGVSAQPVAVATAKAAFTNATFDEVTEKEVYLSGGSTVIDGQKVNAGDVLTYFIKYKNYTGEPVAVDIVDTIPKYTSYVDGSASHNGTFVGTHVNWNLTVAPGEEVEVNFSVKVDKTEVIVANTAVVYDGVNTYHTNEVINHTVEEPAKKDVLSPADVTVSIDGKKVYEGDELVYTISYTNATEQAVDITITDNVPKYTTYVDGSADNSGVYADGKLTWQIDDVAAWETVTVTFKVKVNEDIGAKTVENKATVEAGNRYTTNTVTNYTVEDEVEKKVFLAGKLTQNVDGKKVSAGDELVYEISYKNTAREEATVVITDAVPQNTTLIPNSATPTADYQNGVLTWTLTVPAGETVKVSFKVRVNDVYNIAITNKATVTEGKNTYTTKQVVVQIPDLPTEPDSPQTGDDMNFGLWATLLLLSGMGMVCTLILGRKKETEA